MHFRNLWLKFIADSNNVECSAITQKCIYLCSDHFNDCDKGVKKLKADAVPCILLESVERTVSEELVQNVGEMNVEVVCFFV